jgi:hypothetical protein
MSSKKPKAPRSARREAERDREKLYDARERLSRLSPGGEPSNPIALSTPSLLEGYVRSMPCGRCEGDVQLDEHTAETIDGRRLRLAHVRCRVCGFRRIVYFVIDTPLLN